MPVAGSMPIDERRALVAVDQLGRDDARRRRDGQPSPASTIAGPGIAASPSCASASSITRSWIARRSVFAASSALRALGGRSRRRRAAATSDGSAAPSRPGALIRGASFHATVRASISRSRVDAGRREQRRDARAARGSAAGAGRATVRMRFSAVSGTRSAIVPSATRSSSSRTSGSRRARGTSRARAARCAPPPRRRTPRPTDAMPRNGNVESARNGLTSDERRMRATSAAGTVW